MNTLGAAVRQRREELGLNVSELARQAGVTRQWIEQVERGRIPSPGADRLARLAHTLGTSFEGLLNREQQQLLSLGLQIEQTREYIDIMIRGLISVSPPPGDELQEMRQAATDAARVYLATHAEPQPEALLEAILAAMRAQDRPWAAAALLVAGNDVPRPPVPPPTPPKPSPTKAATRSLLTVRCA